MDFATIGKIGSYVKQKNLTFAANFRIKTGQSIVNSNGHLSFSRSSMFEQMTQATQKTQSEVDATRIANIKSKLMSGRKLTNEEMNYLRENDSDLYKKAKHADDAREELKADLRRAKTKQEARQALTNAMLKASAEASAELAAYKANAAAGGGAAGGAMPTGGDVNVGTVANVGEVGAVEGEGMISANNEITADMQAATSEISQVTNTQMSSETPQSTGNSSLDSDADTPQGIMEKFIMTVRALEDEWMQFTKTKEYEELPEDLFDESESKGDKTRKISNALNYVNFEAALAYRNSMNYRSTV